MARARQVAYFLPMVTRIHPVEMAEPMTFSVPIKLAPDESVPGVNPQTELNRAAGDSFWPVGWSGSTGLNQSDLNK